MKRASTFSNDQRGFTLTELIVAITVLSLLILAIAQVLGIATLATISSRKHMDADGQARMIFDRMADDFSKMVKRTDVDFIFHKNAAGISGVNDSMFFYSEAPAYDNRTVTTVPNSAVSLIGYRINSTTYQFERLGEVLTWDTTTSNDASSTTSNTAPGTVVYLTYAGGATPTSTSMLDGMWIKTIGTVANNYTDGTDSDFHPMGEQTYRLEISFLLSDGTISTKPILSATPSTWPSGPLFYTSTGSDPVLTSDGNTSNSPYYAVGSRWYNTTSGRGYICTGAQTGKAVWNVIGTQDISAIIVALAILDSKSRLIMGAPATVVPTMIGVLPDSVDGTPIAQTWGNSTYLTTSGIPGVAAAQIRIYQRYFYLNNQ